MNNWKENFPKENRFYETSNGILYNGNCIEIMDKIKENSIDLIVTSPPYNVGIKYEDYEDTLSPKEYFNFVKTFLIKFNKILKTDGRFCINIPYDTNMKHYQNKEKRISLICEYYQLLKETNLQFKTIVDLVENNPHKVKYTAWGSWLSPSSPYIYNPKEGILIGYKKQWKKIKKGEKDITKEEFIEIVSGMWKYRAQTKKITQANFSSDIPYKAIKGLSFKNNIIMDPFSGSGTTLIEAEKLNRRWIGIELSSKYCEIIKQLILKEIV